MGSFVLVSILCSLSYGPWNYLGKTYRFGQLLTAPYCKFIFWNWRLKLKKCILKCSTSVITCSWNKGTVFLIINSRTRITIVSLKINQKYDISVEKVQSIRLLLLEGAKYQASAIRRTLFRMSKTAFYWQVIKLSRKYLTLQVITGSNNSFFFNPIIEDLFPYLIILSSMLFVNTPAEHVAQLLLLSVVTGPFLNRTKWNRAMGRARLTLKA